MPAPFAFLITQAAVVATSVAPSEIDWGAAQKEVRKPQPVIRSGRACNASGHVAEACHRLSRRGHD